MSERKKLRIEIDPLDHPNCAKACAKGHFKDATRSVLQAALNGTREAAGEDWSYSTADVERATGPAVVKWHTGGGRGKIVVVVTGRNSPAAALRDQERRVENSTPAKPSKVETIPDPEARTSGDPDAWTSRGGFV